MGSAAGIAELRAARNAGGCLIWTAATGCRTRVPPAKVLEVKVSRTGQKIDNRVDAAILSPVAPR
jgi:hypothetical protein